MTTDDIADENPHARHREILEGEGVDLSTDAPSLAGLIDSFGLMSLLGFVEERFGVSIPTMKW